MTSKLNTQEKDCNPPLRLQGGELHNTHIINIIQNYKNMKSFRIITLIALVLFGISVANAQNESNNLKLSGYLQTDQRLLTQSPNDWAWNENRLSLQLDKAFAGKAKFHAEVWLRNMGIPHITSSADLYNKGIVDPWNLEIREANVHIYGLFTKNLDVTIGRQRIAWGTADRFNPTDNVNPYDMEDILDFGRHRGSDALSMQYYFNSGFSLQAVYVPFFRPDNLPVGIFSNLLQPAMELPAGLTLKSYGDRIDMPEYNVKESSQWGARFKGFVKGVDFSLSYLYGREGLPFSVYNTLLPVDTLGGVKVESQLEFPRTHIFGADFAANVFGAGLWGEAALFVPADSVVMTTDITALVPGAPYPVTFDSTVLAKKPYVKFVLGTDYSFANNAYLNVQYLHGFINERGSKNLNDYFILRYEINFLDNKLKIAPISGGVVVNDWKNIKNNYALFYVPQITYMATDNVELNVSAGIFGGKGENLFSKLSSYNMMIFKMKYSF